MIASIVEIDTAIFLFLNGLHKPWLDAPFYWISQTVVWIPLFLLFAGYVVYKWRRKSWVIIPLFALIVLLTDQSCNLIKQTVQRPRPSHTEAIAGEIHLVQRPNGDTYYGGQFGFPSAHAANTIAFAWMVFFFMPVRRKWVIAAAFGWSLLLSYSRIYLGVHYPFDILTGWVVGSCWSVGLSQLALLLLKRRCKKES